MQQHSRNPSTSLSLSFSSLLTFEGPNHKMYIFVKLSMKALSIIIFPDLPQNATTDSPTADQVPELRFWWRTRSQVTLTISILTIRSGDCPRLEWTGDLQLPMSWLKESWQFDSNMKFFLMCLMMMMMMMMMKYQQMSQIVNNFSRHWFIHHRWESLCWRSEAGQDPVHRRDEVWTGGMGGSVPGWTYREERWQCDEHSILHLWTETRSLLQTVQTHQRTNRWRRRDS